ncbi:NADH dehydrogenase [ubiquinone] 1 alpha subcomplex subunit 6-like [Amyelois transitella]|uniref:NADH dehydrogenase [ubiquinone] 1 alpha subcomplex subunit 6-like n=1 Tax=Amyelois transitella TaxID=680683 RepID=UPI00067C8F54|nr:NADH dehydrogenase [ubiquinone] 1 alpha subcomplex subunit 6-like [Amyelois transitella]
MAANETVKAACKTAKAVMSTDFWEARRRVLGLYRAFYRYIPYIIKYFDIPKTEQDCRYKLREYFYANACVTDVRVIDILVIKGYMELKEVTHQWQQKGHVMAHWKPSWEPKPNNFICKFLSGVD